jgi:uncharacterized protein (DUF58 family)
VAWFVGLGAGSLAVIAFPELTLPLWAANVSLLLVGLLDLLITPGPRVLSAARETPERGSLLGKHSIAIRVRNTSRARLRLWLKDDVPRALRPGVSLLSNTVGGSSQIEFTYTIQPAARGKFLFGDIHIRYRSLLGLWERSRIVEAPAEIKVYPSIEDVDRYHLLAKLDHLSVMGIRQVRIRGASWEFESLREFVNGDDTRLMDWKATARRSRLIIRNQQAERHQTVILLVDCGRLMTAEEKGVSKLDRAVNSALLLGHVGLSRGDRVGLCAFSATVHTWVAPRPHAVQLRLLTEALYDLKADYTETDHARCLREVALQHRKRALLVVLSDFVDAVTAKSMVAAVRHAARRHVVLFLALRDPFLKRAAEATSADEETAFRQAVALSLLRERLEVLEGLRRYGVQVVDVNPEELTANLVNKYLEISFRGLL